jgi:phage terminase large subunit-like protein
LSTNASSNWLRRSQEGWAADRIGANWAKPVLAEWFGQALPGQYPETRERDIRLVVGGRGAGKTRLGAEWVNGLVSGFPPFAGWRYGKIALVGETLAEVREVMIDGPSGIRACARRDRPRFEAGRRRLLWECGAVAHIFSAEDPESLRGPQFEAAWLDELAKWRNVEACWDTLQFGLRLGRRPCQLITTTPRPLPLLKRLLADPAVAVTRLKSGDNAQNLAPGFLEAVRRRYAGTRLGRQELDGELIEDREDALWSRRMLEQTEAREGGELSRIVVAVDPPASSRKTSDACGIVAAGLTASGTVLVLADRTLRAAKPRQWAARAVALFHELQADCLVVEVNQGGEMASAVIRTVDAAVPIKPVRASRGKWLRAEPVAALYSQGRVRHAGRFPELEDEMCDFGPDGLSNGRSPDRLDALVWAVSELTAGQTARPRIRDFL